MAELTPGNVLFTENFNDPAGGWGTGVVPDGEYGYENGAYRILVKPASRQLSRHVEGPRAQGLMLEIRATLVSGTTGDGLGILCYTDVGADEGYMLAISPADRSHVIYRFRGESYELLEGGDEPSGSIRPVGEANDLEVQCANVPGGPSPNFLTLLVNSLEVGHAFDEELSRGFDAVGMVVDTTAGGAEGHFDDFVATELLVD